MESPLNHPTAGDYAWAASQDVQKKNESLEARLDDLTERVVFLESSLLRVVNVLDSLV